MKGRMARWPSPSPSPTAWRFRDRSRLLPWTALLPSSPSLRIVISGSLAGLGACRNVQPSTCLMRYLRFAAPCRFQPASVFSDTAADYGRRIENFGFAGASEVRSYRPDRISIASDKEKLRFVSESRKRFRMKSSTGARRTGG